MMLSFSRQLMCLTSARLHLPAPAMATMDWATLASICGDCQVRRAGWHIRPRENDAMNSNGIIYPDGRPCSNGVWMTHGASTGSQVGCNVHRRVGYPNSISKHLAFRTRGVHMVCRSVRHTPLFGRMHHAVYCGAWYWLLLDSTAYGEAMQYVPLGRTGLRVSVMGLGGGGHSRLGQHTGRTPTHSVALVERALDLGVNVLDTAEVYHTEAIIGTAIRHRSREELVLSTKKTITRADGAVISAQEVIAGTGCLGAGATAIAAARQDPLSGYYGSLCCRSCPSYVVARGA